jgi:hypothetical protein
MSLPKLPVWPTVLVLAVLVGASLRLVWVQDMEYKADEEYTFERSQQMGRGEPWSWTGMPTSMGIPNPGMSVWVFVGLARLFGISEPTGLARAVQCLNVAALGLLAWFAWFWVKPEQREPWLWAVVLAAVNPMGVLFQRKIWPPSIFPVFCTGMIMAWWRRDRFLGAFCWGLIGACMGQIHMSAFLIAAVLFLWTLLFARQNVRWLGWLLGSVLGALPLIPCLPFLFEAAREPVAPLSWEYALQLQYWRTWIFDGLGLDLAYSLREHFRDFLAYPLIGEKSTGLVAVAHLLLFGMGLFLAGNGAVVLWKRRGQWRELLTGGDSPTRLSVMASLLGCGLLVSLSGIYVHRHYLIVLFPLTYVGLALLALAAPRGRFVLATVCVLQLFLSICFLGYIHVNQGAPRGDYGVAYGAQHRQ